MVISVTLMDGRTLSLPVDSASTSKEVCQILSQKVKLQDTFGFSLYVAVFDKVCFLFWSLVLSIRTNLILTRLLMKSIILYAPRFGLSVVDVSM